MSYLLKLQQALKRQKILHDYPFNYTLPDLFDSLDLKCSSKYRLPSGEIRVDPYEFFDELINSLRKGNSEPASLIIWIIQLHVQLLTEIGFAKAVFIRA